MPESEETEPFFYQGANGVGAELAANVCGCPSSDVLAQAVRIDEPAQAIRRVFDVRLGPFLPCGVNAHRLFEFLELVTDGEGIVGRHEIHVGRPTRGNHRLAEVHHFGRGEAEAFCAVQGEKNVAAGLEIPGLLPGQEIVDEGDVGKVGYAFLQFGSGGGVVMAVDGLDHQHDVTVVGGGFPECGERGLGVLPVLVGVEVVHDENEQLVFGKPEVAASCFGAGRKFKGVRDFDNRYGREGGDGVVYEC